MTIIQSVLLGLIQGLTEFMPISSSGHLAVIENLFKMNDGSGLIYPVVLHLGTLVAVCFAFSKDIHRLVIESIHILRDFFLNIKSFALNKTRQDALRYRKVVYNNYRKFAVLLWITSFATALIGILFRNTASDLWSGLLGSGIGFLITSVVLFVAHAAGDGENLPREVSLWTALLIGVGQGFAVMPGISRLGITLTICLLCGFNKKFAVKYAFISGIPVTLGAMIFELRKGAAASMDWGAFGICFLGALVAGVVGFFTIRFFVRFVEQRKLNGFAIYCLLSGLCVLCCSFLFT